MEGIQINLSILTVLFVCVIQAGLEYRYSFVNVYE